MSSVLIPTNHSQGIAPAVPGQELWVVNALISEIENTDLDQKYDLFNPKTGRLGAFPVYASRAYALAAHPEIAKMAPYLQDYYLRCIGSEQA